MPLSELHRAIQQDECIIHSEKTVYECGQYEIGSAGTRSGKCIHVGSRASGDPASQGKSHGDCAIAAALAWMAAQDRPVTKTDVRSEELVTEETLQQQLERRFNRRRRMPLAGADRFEDFRFAS
jgi:hypothetical protein